MNNQKGLFFCCGGANNIAYNNCFIKNTDWHAQDDEDNTWDNGKIGNYWDDYTGPDANGDGVGDTSYQVNGGSSERFPLMQPSIRIGI